MQMGDDFIKTFFGTLKKNGLRYGGVYFFYTIAAAVVAVSATVSAIITGQMGQSAYEGDLSALWGLLVLLSVLFGVRAVLSALEAFIRRRYWADTSYTVRQNFMQHFLRKPFSALEKTNTGEALSIFQNDLPGANSLISIVAMQMISDFLVLIVALAYMFMLQPLYTALFLLTFPLLVVMQAIISKPIQKKSAKMSEDQAKFNAIVNDSLQNTATVIAYSLEDTVEKRYLVAYDKFLESLKGFLRTMSILVLAGILFTLLPIFFANLISGISVINSNMTIAEYIAYAAIAMRAGSWLMMLSQNLTGLRQRSAEAIRLNDLTSGEEEDLDRSADISAEGLALEFDSVNFAYAEDGEDVLKGISFSIAKGRRVALIGGSGSGKSSVLKLVLGMYKPKNGKISIFGQDIAQLPVASLRNLFAYVPQDSFLLPQSIGENITGKKERTPEEQRRLAQACADAGILDFINTLPNKFDDMLAESSENISGGQRQRIALARAFYRDAPIILFDEATSALDPTTEAQVLATLENLPPDKTLIMVAHRASAIGICDTIVSMEEGKILKIEEGASNGK